MLEIKDLSVTFESSTINEKKALEKVNIFLEDGDFLTIVGSNGAGKSTLLNSIFGLCPTTSGSIILNGKKIDNLKSYKRAKEIGIMFQDPLKGTAPNMTIYENMSLALGKKAKKEEMISLVKSLKLGLETRLNTKMGLLSGGERQAISLLMATGANPSLLLLDEHTAALDPQTSKTIMDLTKQIVKEKKLTTIMITHNVQSAIDYGNKLLFMNKGKVLKLINEKEKKELTVNKVMSLYKNELTDEMIL